MVGWFHMAYGLFFSLSLSLSLSLALCRSLGGFLSCPLSSVSDLLVFASRYLYFFRSFSLFFIAVLSLPIPSSVLSLLCFVRFSVPLRFRFSVPFRASPLSQSVSQSL